MSRPNMTALRKYNLTPEDQGIFERFTEQRTQDRYHFADVRALIRASAAMRAFGSVRECVTTIETAQRSIEQRGGK